MPGEEPKLYQHQEVGSSPSLKLSKDSEKQMVARLPVGVGQYEVEDEMVERLSSYLLWPANACRQNPIG